MKQDFKPEISVIMGVYNPPESTQLEMAINSILNQTFRDFEFIIYDDGSNTETANVIKKKQSDDSRIHFIRCDTNHGLAFSLNQCINEANGKYFARMDADDISLPTRLEKEYNFLEVHQEYDWVGCNAIVFTEESVLGIRKMAEVPNQYNFLPFSPYIHPTVMFRRELFEKGNKYNISDKTLRCEDYELFMRLYQQGYRGYNLQENLFFYREGVATYRKRTLKSRWNETKIRRQYFCRMDLPVKKRYLYILRPLVTMFIPYSIIINYKRIRLRELEPLTGRMLEIYQKFITGTIQGDELDVLSQ